MLFVTDVSFSFVILDTNDEPECFKVAPSVDATAIEAYNFLVVADLELLEIATAIAGRIVEVYLSVMLVQKSQFLDCLVCRSMSLHFLDWL